MKRGAITPGSARALVTGAGSGIGRCYALRLAALGYDLVLAGNRREPLEAAAAEIRAAANRCDVRIVEIDLARTEAAEEFWEAVRREGVEIDVLINNAGIFSFRDILRDAARAHRADHPPARPHEHPAVPSGGRRHGAQRLPGVYPQHVLLLAVDAFPGLAVQRVESLSAVVLGGVLERGAGARHPRHGGMSGRASPRTSTG